MNVSKRHRGAAVMKRKMARNRGTVLLEFVFASVFLVIVCLVVLDFGVCFYTAWVNDSLARDAARAASQQKSKDKAYMAAFATVQRFAHASILMTAPEMTAFTYELKENFNGRPQRRQDPFVMVRTQTIIRFPAPIVMNGTRFQDKAVFSAGYVFPIMSLPVMGKEKQQSIAMTVSLPNLPETNSQAPEDARQKATATSTPTTVQWQQQPGSPIFTQNKQLQTQLPVSSATVAINQQPQTLH